MKIYVVSMSSAKEVAVLPSNPLIMTFCFIRYQQHKENFDFRNSFSIHSSLFILFQMIVTSKVFVKGTNNFFYQNTHVNRGRSDRILPQRDMADSILYGGRKGKRRETLARSIVVSRLNRENCCFLRVWWGVRNGKLPWI